MRLSSPKSSRRSSTRRRREISVFRTQFSVFRRNALCVSFVFSPDATASHALTAHCRAGGYSRRGFANSLRRRRFILSPNASADLLLVLRGRRTRGPASALLSITPAKEGRTLSRQFPLWNSSCLQGDWDAKKIYIAHLCALPLIRQSHRKYGNMILRFR